MASFYTTAVYGFHVETKSILSKAPNPKYNPNAPFDPKTGARIPQFIEDKSTLDNLRLDARKLGFTETSTTDGNDTFIGIVAKNSACIGEGGEEFSSLQEFNLPEIHSKLAALASKYGISKNSITFHAVGNCSY